MAQYIEMLIAMRFFQAIGISMCSIGGKAAVRDIFSSDQTARVFSIMGMIMGIAPIIAPTLGSWLLLGFGWRSIFYFLALFTILLLILLWAYFPNTGVTLDYSLNYKNVLGKYGTVIKNRKYLIYTLLTSLAGTILFLWITSSSFIFIELLGISEGQFGLIFAATSVSLLISNKLNLILLKNYSSETISIVALTVQIFICALLFYIVRYNFNVTSMLIGICLLMLCLLLFRVNVMSICLNSVEEDLGIASAFLGGFRMAMSAIGTFALSFFLKDSAMPMILAVSVLTVISVILQYLARLGTFKT